MVHDGAVLPFLDRGYTSVITLGTTVHDQNYKQLLLEAWRVADEKLLFDIRLTPNQEVCSLDDGFVQDGSDVRYPYVIANGQDFFDWIRTFSDLAKVKVYGYWGSANPETTLPEGYEQICMACILLEKSPKNLVKRDLPCWTLNLPAEVTPDVTVFNE